MNMIDNSRRLFLKILSKGALFISALPFIQNCQDDSEVKGIGNYEEGTYGAGEYGMGDYS